MAKLYAIKESDKELRKRKIRRDGRRFFTSKDLAILKHDIAVKNSRDKRGEISRSAHEIIVPCGCQAPGCFIQHDIKPNPVLG